MNLQERIDRRRSAHGNGTIVVDRTHLAPVVHRPEPVGRGSVIEQLLDALEPVFGGDLPDPVAVVGPQGAGKSAVVTATFDALNDRLGTPDRSIETTTRAGPAEPVTWFVTVDARGIDSEFAFYRALLSGITSEPVPSGGIGTEEVRDRLRSRLDRSDRRAVVAVDHHDEPGSLGFDRVRDLLEPMADSLSLVAVGQEPPDGWHEARITVPAYRQHELVDVLTARASTGLAPGVLEHEAIRDLADWADGDAHDAFAALFTAAVFAGDDGGPITDAHLERAKADVPADSVHVGRALAVPRTRQRVLLELVRTEDTRAAIRDLAEVIADRTDLTAGTVERFLYELADRGVLERTPLPGEGSGRSPSSVEPRFPLTVFRTLTTAEGADST
ncbi:Cdc6/Cdc18 family protein [Halopiger goleimassiliensis]|uniref:Cdc6/Cdc18 family protein n=1 Tax=Halopiger goleimassiliensis TaxID=1293048 RepID=UPI00067815F0|nr:AAA family ATPase [Halopiger goleimassiliensis]